MRSSTNLDSSASEPTKYEREYRAFQALLPSLLQTHRGLYVAIHNEQMVDSGDDEFALVRCVFAKVGNVPIHVGLVTENPPIARIPHYREVGQCVVVTIKQIEVVGATPRKIDLTDQPVHRIDPAEFAQALGATPIGQVDARTLDLIDLGESGAHFLRRSRSKDG